MWLKPCRVIPTNIVRSSGQARYLETMLARAKLYAELQERDLNWWCRSVRQSDK